MHTLNSLRLYTDKKKIEVKEREKEIALSLY